LLIAGLILLRGPRSQAEEQARQRRKRIKAILTALPDLMFFQTPDGEFLDYHANRPEQSLRLA
jgi:PAS domain-containing protein